MSAARVSYMRPATYLVALSWSDRYGEVGEVVNDWIPRQDPHIVLRFADGRTGGFMLDDLRPARASALVARSIESEVLAGFGYALARASMVRPQVFRLVPGPVSP